MPTDRFRSVALVLREYIGNTYDLLNAVDDVVALDDTIVRPLPTITTPDGKATWNWTQSCWDFIHDSLVNVALFSPTVLDAVRDGKKILAIKELRAETGCGLKEAKLAVEDYRVMAESDHYDRTRDHDEPPF